MGTGGTAGVRDIVLNRWYSDPSGAVGHSIPLWANWQYPQTCRYVQVPGNEQAPRFQEAQMVKAVSGRRKGLMALRGAVTELAGVGDRPLG